MTEPQLEYVGFWPRFGAFIIDSILVSIVLFPLANWAYDDMSGIPMGMFWSPASIFFNGIAPAIAIIIFWIYRQATPGKMLIHAKIVDATTGGKPSTGQMIGRYFAYYVSTIPLCLGFLWIAFDPRKQGWHDKLAGTLVVRAR